MHKRLWEHWKTYKYRGLEVPSNYRENECATCCLEMVKRAYHNKLLRTYAMGTNVMVKRAYHNKLLKTYAMGTNVRSSRNTFSIFWGGNMELKILAFLSQPTRV